MYRKILASSLTAICMSLASPGSVADTSIGVRIGTLGGGLELAHAFTETLGFASPPTSGTIASRTPMRTSTTTPS